MSTFGADNHSTPLFPSVGRTVRSTAAVDALRTSFAVALEESKRKESVDDEPAPERRSEQKSSIEDNALRKTLDKHEMEASIDRGRQLDDEYQHRTDRRELVREKPEPETVSKNIDFTTETKNFETVSGNVPLSVLSAVPPNIVWSQRNTATGLPSVTDSSPPTVATTVPADIGFPPTILFPQTAAVAAPVLPTAPTSTIDSLPKPPTDLSAFTIFTVSGRFGTAKKEKESDDKKSEKRERSVSLFGPLLSATVETDDEGTPLEKAQGARRSKNPNESPEQTPTEPANIESPKKEKAGSPLKELFDSKAFVPTFELYTGNLPEQVDDTKSDVQTQADRVRFVQRVAAACQSAAQQQGTVRIKLHPEALGPLTVRVVTKKGKISVRFETESDDAKRLLIDSLNDLKSRLHDMQLELDDFLVD